MTKEEAFKEINDTQDYYVNELANLIFDKKHSAFKAVYFTSATGTGKTRMMSKLMNKMSDCYFVVTTLSKGQLNKQIKKNLEEYSLYRNFNVYGTCDYKINSNLQASEIINDIPKNKKCIWLRDEGHINTNRFDELLADKCFKIVNFSATNQKTDIKCNFTNTMMLRTVHQDCGTPEDAIKKLLEVKKLHKKVKDYNPCAIFRCIDSNTILNQIEVLCEQYNLKYINITEENFNMEELCEDDNEYDVIINKFKITEGIDLRRAHVIYMDNQPKNNSTTIQVVGRARRNALLYRNDIDIFEKNNKTLLNDTRQCYVFYNVKSMYVEEDENGELIPDFCDKISIEKLKCDSVIEVNEGKLPNGLTIIELEKETGKFKVLKDVQTGFNVVKPEGEFYKEEIIQRKNEPYLFIKQTDIPIRKYRLMHFYYKVYKIEDILKTKPIEEEFDWGTGANEKCEKFYDLTNIDCICEISNFSLKGLKNIVENKKNYIETKTILKTMKLHYDNLLQGIFEKENNKFIWKSINSSMTEEFYHENNFEIEIITHVTKQKPTFKKINELLAQLEKIEIDIENKYHNMCFLTSVFANKNSANTISVFSNLPKVSHNFLTSLNVGYTDYCKINNDRESAIIGVDTMKIISTEERKNIFVEERAVTAKIKKWCKFNSFLEKQYFSELKESRKLTFTGKNQFEFEKKCDSCLGYLVEYYSKYLIYGEQFLNAYIEAALKESKVQTSNTNIIVRACMLKYKDMMKTAFGVGVEKVIPTISIEKLIQQNYKVFVSTVVELAVKTSTAIKKIIGYAPKNDIDPNLSIKHLTGLADYITKDTIVDIKVQNYIDIENVKQVLAYHYLSTKRSDLNIKKLYIYDAPSNKAIFINLESQKVELIDMEQ